MVESYCIASHILADVSSLDKIYNKISFKNPLKLFVDPSKNLNNLSFCFYQKNASLENILRYQKLHELLSLLTWLGRYVTFLSLFMNTLTHRI